MLSCSRRLPGGLTFLLEAPPYLLRIRFANRRFVWAHSGLAQWQNHSIRYKYNLSKKLRMKLKEGGIQSEYNLSVFPFAKSMQGIYLALLRS
jgi:hypothetical protein